METIVRTNKCSAEKTFRQASPACLSIISVSKLSVFILIFNSMQ